MNPILWKPNDELIDSTFMTDYMKSLYRDYHVTFENYQALHQWSVDYPEWFWASIWKYCEILASQDSQQILEKNKVFQKTKWFLGASLNFSQNLLRRQDDHIALYFASEDGERRSLSYRELYEQVFIVSDYLRNLGVKAGDRVVGFLPNIPETIIAMLAAASLGAIWSSCSPDFGLAGLLDRFSQIKPKILFSVDEHNYHGKKFNHLEKIKNLQFQLPSLQKTIFISFLEKSKKISDLSNTIFYHEILSQYKNQNKSQIDFAQLPFDHPLYILYSSGTTGKPKCIVHGAGGALIQHLKELKLHCDLKPHNKIFFYTTCGWMMWNWMVSSLAAGASIVLYEGSPFYPTQNTLYDLIDELGITHFGVGAKIIEMSEKYRLSPMKTHSLKSLRNILTTASPLLPENFDYIYEQIKKDVCVSSITGGTDILSLFGAGNLNLPVYRGEIQCLGLGMNVKIFNEEGKSIVNEKGELVCASPFPSMPIYFWGDPEGEKYQQAYFEQFPGVWAHGDYALINEHGGMIMYGRSDATLKPGGVRIGTAEIYNQMEKIPEVLESLAIGQTWEGSERIILFVTLPHQNKLTNELITKIKSVIRENTSPRHVPAKIIQVPDLPKTINGKIAELAVKKIIENQPIKNITALANPESLEFFKDLPELKME